MNWNLPTVTDLYTDIIAYFKGRDDDCARMFASGSPTNLPVDTIRWSSAGNKFEKWSGSAWGNLTSKYLFDVDTLDGQHGSYYQNAANLNAGTIPVARLPASISSSTSGNAATATSPQSGGSFITSSNIGSQNVNYAGSAGSTSGNAATATNPQSGGSFITSSNIGSQNVNYAGNAGTVNAVAHAVLGAALSVLPIGNVGSHGFLRIKGGAGNIQLGVTQAGSSLSYTQSAEPDTGLSPAGTWVSCGHNSSTNTTAATLWKRIA